MIPLALRRTALLMRKKKDSERQRKSASAIPRKWGNARSTKGKPYKSSLPVNVQAAVIGLYLTNHRKVQIAKMIGIDRETVHRIISQQENQILLSGYRDAVMKMVPNALVQAYELVERGDRQMVTDVLYGARVLIDRRETEEIKPPQERTYDYPKVEYFAKYGKWPSLEQAKEFEKTMDIEALVKKET